MNIFHQTMIYAASVRTDLECLELRFWYYL